MLSFLRLSLATWWYFLDLRTLTHVQRKILQSVRGTTMQYWQSLSPWPSWILCPQDFWEAEQESSWRRGLDFLPKSSSNLDVEKSKDCFNWGVKFQQENNYFSISSISSKIWSLSLISPPIYLHFVLTQRKFFVRVLSLNWIPYFSHFCMFLKRINLLNLKQVKRGFTNYQPKKLLKTS